MNKLSNFLSLSKESSLKVENKLREEKKGNRQFFLSLSKESSLKEIFEKSAYIVAYDLPSFYLFLKRVL